jgi:hypothetical protein
MKRRTAFRFLTLGLLALALPGGSALAGGDRGWERGWWSGDRGHRPQYGRHLADRGYGWDRRRHWDRWDRASAPLWRDGRWCEAPWGGRPTFSRGERWR